MSVKIEQLKITELKTKLCQAAKQSRATMAPMLYWLRDKIKKRGKAGQGFGPWVEKHLDISRRTADRWADEYGISESLTKKKPKRTSGHVSKGKGGNLDDIDNGPSMVWCNLSLRVTQSEEENLLSDWDLLGDEDATRLVCDALRHAAKEKAKNEASPDPFPVELGELQELGTKKPTQPVGAITPRLTLVSCPRNK